jgi:hypothetical protein
MPAPKAHQEWSRLLLAAQNGEAASFARLLNAATPFLRVVARGRLGKASDAERAVQQALLTIHGLRRTYDPSVPIGPWLAAIVEAEARRLAPQPNAGAFGVLAAQLRRRLIPGGRPPEGNVNLAGI